MKKVIFSIIIMVAAFASNAQKKSFEYDQESTLRFGGKAGVNINNINGKPFSDEFSYNFLLGGFIQWNVTKKWGIQPEVNFSQFSYQVTDDASDVLDEFRGLGDQKKGKLDYLKIPVLVNLNIGPSQRVKLQLGPQWAALLSDSNNKNAKRFFKNADFSMLGGLWLQLPFVNLGGRYEVGLSDINNITHSDKWNSQAFTFFVGVTF